MDSRPGAYLVGPNPTPLVLSLPPEWLARVLPTAQIGTHMPIEPGQTLTHFRILSKIGQGGMGEVYRAHDERLNREVAVKVLSTGTLVDESARKRFRREALALSRLNHPNIETVHDFDTQEGVDFLVMEYIPGVTLNETIAAGALPEKVIARLGVQLAEGLTAAHDQGVIHRDLKPGNLRVTPDGRLKILDFGLAKILQPRTPTATTQSVTVTPAMAGTLPYMAPEQLQGEKADPRTDIYAVGVVLYEMATGQLPFSEELSSQMTDAILHQTPVSPRAMKPNVSPDLERIILKCLDKEPENRYQSAKELGVDLRRLGATETTPVVSEPSRRRWVGVATLGVVAVLVIVFGYWKFVPEEVTSERKMIVVLPFENLGPAEDEYFAAGMTEEITSRLAVVSGLGVISRKSAIQYANTDKSTMQIGKELGVDYLLEGTVRWARQSGGASRVRITPQLIRVRDDTHLWAETYERVIEDIFQIQSDIAGKVIEQLGVTLLEPERRAVEARPTEVVEAYDAYLRGNQYYHRSYREQDFRIAVQMYEKAVELDPSFALAYAKLSEAHSGIYWFHYDRSEERLARAKEAAEKAFTLEPDLPDAHQAQGWYYYYGHLEYDHALEQFAIALKSQPNNAELFDGIGSVRRRQGKPEQAVADFEKAVELDPRSAQLSYEAAQTYFLLRNYVNAERYFDRTFSLSPDLAYVWGDKARLYLTWEGSTEKARSVLEEASQTIGPTDDPFVVLAWVLVEVCDGKYQEALDRLSLGSSDTLESQFFFIPKAQLSAQIHGWMNRPQLAREDYETAQALLETKLREQPRDERLHSSLGIAYAGLGRVEEAIREGKMGVELMPVSKEAWRGVFRVEDLARIYVMVGEYDAAIDQLEFLLSRPGVLSIWLLRLDPHWKPLWDHPRFQELVEKYG